MLSFCLRYEGLLKVSSDGAIWGGFGKEDWFNICIIGVILRPADVYLNVLFGGASVELNALCARLHPSLTVLASFSYYPK